jgi:hypothetical protein
MLEDGVKVMVYAGDKVRSPALRTLGHFSPKYALLRK